METTPTTPEGEVKKKSRSRNEDGEKALKKTGSAIRLRVERDSSKERDKSERDKSEKKKKKKKDKSSSSSSSSKSSKSREKDKEKERDPEKKKRKGSRSSPSKGRSRSSTKEKEKEESGTTPPSSPKSSSTTAVTATATFKKEIDEEDDDEYDTSDDESSEEESPITHILMNSVSLPRLALRKKEFVDPEANPRRFVRQLLLTPPRPRATEPLESPPSPPSQLNGRGRSSPELKGTQTLLDEDERERTLSRRRAHTSLVRPKFLDQLAKDNLIDAGPLVGSGEDIERRQNVFRAVHRRSKSETFLHTWDYSYIDFWDAYEYDKGMRSGDAYGTNANIIPEVSPLITKREVAAVSTSEMPIERRAALLKEELEAAFKFSSSTIGKHIGYSIEGKVESGSINGLLAELLGYNISNSTFVRQFLLSCPYFVEDPCLIIDKLLDVYGRTISVPNVTAEERSELQVTIQLRVLDVFQTWITVGYPDLIENPKLLKHLSEVMRMLHTLASENSLRKGISALEEILKRGNQPFLTGPSPTSLKPKVMRSDRSFLDFHPLEIARQLSMIEYDMLKAVPLTEYRNKRFATPEKSPNLAIVVDRFNKVCSWVAEEILSTANIKKRIVVLGRFIEVADHCRLLKNFSSLMAIVSALNRSFIQRLKLTWKGLPQKTQQTMQKLMVLMEPSSNYKNYRAVLKEAPFPFIPFQGVIFVDLTFIEENPDVVGSGLINFAKMRMISDQLLPLARLKTTPYNFAPIPEIQALLKNVRVVNDEVLYKQSKLNEPGASGKEGKKKKRTFSDEDVVRETIEEWKGINFRQQGQQDRGVLRKDISLRSLTLKRDLSPLMETRSLRG